MFISVDGPSGAGKSTIVRHLAQMLVAAGENVHITAEPSNGPIGVLCRELTESVTGHALACLYAADRYHHVQTEIRPRMESGETVISDRYMPSGLVIQRFDGIDPAFLWHLNSEADRALSRRDHVNALALALRVSPAEIAPAAIPGLDEWASAPPPTCAFPQAGDDITVARHRERAGRFIGYVISGDTYAAGAWLRRCASAPATTPRTAASCCWWTPSARDGTTFRTAAERWSGRC